MPTSRPSTNFAKAPFSKGIGCLFFVFAMLISYLIAAIVREQQEDVFQAHKRLSFFGKIGIPCMIAGALLGPFARRRSRRHDDRAQAVRDKHAATILEAVQRGDSVYFAVYLRSFWITGNALTSYSEYADAISGDFIDYSRRDFEYVLAAATQETTPLIGLGRLGEAIGIGRIETDDTQWKDNVKMLCRAAHHIYVSPLDTEGTRWEMQFLKDEGLLEKSVFVMPPSNSSFNKSELGQKWNSARIAYDAIGIQIPEYSSYGQLFRIDKNGRLLTISADVLEDNPDRLRHQIAQFLTRHQMLETSAICPGCGCSESTAAKGQDSALFVRMIRICSKCGSSYRRPNSFATQLAEGLGYFAFALVFAMLAGIVLIQDRPGEPRRWFQIIFAVAFGSGAAIAMIGFLYQLGVGFRLLLQPHSRQPK